MWPKKTDHANCWKQVDGNCGKCNHQTIGLQTFGWLLQHISKRFKVPARRLLGLRAKPERAAPQRVRSAPLLCSLCANKLPIQSTTEPHASFLQGHVVAFPCCTSVVGRAMRLASSWLSKLLTGLPQFEDPIFVTAAKKLDQSALFPLWSVCWAKHPPLRRLQGSGAWSK